MSNSAALKKVLIVDDDPTTVTIIKCYLENAGFEVDTANEGKQAIEKLENKSNELMAVVSDVNMPVMNGYELCRSIRANPTNAHVPFIFVSVNTSLEEKLEGYAAGGDDYVTKPVEPEELALKLNKIIDKNSNENKLNARLQESQKAAFQAMSYTSQLGQVLQFVQSSMIAHSLEELAPIIFAVTNGFSLHCVLQFRRSDGVSDFSSTGPVTPLESNVIEMACTKGRIYDFAARTVFNHEDFSLLIKNMPVENEARYGSLKDTLGNLCNAIEVRTKFILANDMTAKKDEVLNTVNTAVVTVEESLNEIHNDNLNAMGNMIDDLENAMISLGLSESQGEQMREIFDVCMKKTDEIFEKSKKINDQFASILDILGSK